MSGDNHKHKWIWVELGTGVYQKGEQNIRVEVPGMLCRCVCTKLMFFPDDKRLNDVEVGLESLVPSDAPSGQKAESKPIDRYLPPSRL